MKKCLTAIIVTLAFAAAMPASAQFNIGSLVEKGKKKAERVVNNAAGKLTGNANAQEAPGVQTGTAAQGVDPQLFPYDRQQFAADGLYLDGTEKVENFLLYVYVKVCEALTAKEGARSISINACIPLQSGGKVLAYGEPVVNAFFYDYMQNPNDYKNFRQMIKAYVVAYNYGFGFLKTPLVEGSQTQMKDAEGKTQTLWESEADRVARNQCLLRAAEELSTRSDYQNVFESTYSIYTQAEKAYNAGNKVAAYNNYRELQFAWNNFLTKHPGWNSDGRAAQFTQMYNAAMAHNTEIRLSVIDENKVPQDMPPTYKGIAGVESKVRMCIGREDPEHKNAPVVFLSQGWRPLYRSGSNIIDQRAVDVGWTYTDAKGQKWLAYTTLMQKAVYHGLTVQYIDSYMFSGGFKTMKLK